MIRRITLLALLCCALPVIASADGTKVVPLTAAEVPALLKPPTHGERIIMLWALDCVYCEPNMQALAKLQRAHPEEIELIFIDTDDISRNASTIAKRLAVTGVQGYPARAYASAATAQMNFLIDPAWGGETPRTLVIRSNGTRSAISGALTPAQLRKLRP